MENWQIGIVLFIGETDPFEPAWFNEIYHNNIIDNALQAWDANSMNNYWYENYWSDYPGEDTDYDGIGDTSIPWPFLWSGYDNSPYMEENGWE
jgi:nitrous oxidase accessory protein NosD